MAFLEYGTLQGLARDFGYGERTQDLYNQEALLEKARDKAEAKAKLMTDDLDYMLPMNEYDRPIADSFVKEQLKNIGLYYKNNPDVFTNVQKRIELNRMKKQLKEHPSIVNGVMNDIELKKWDDFVADPKNAALRESDDFKIVSKQRENFLKNGNPDTDIPDGTYKNYKFRSPMENFDFTKYLQEQGKLVDYDKELIEQNDQFTRKFVTDAKITDVSRLLLNGKQKAKIDRIWEDIPKEEKDLLLGDTDDAKKVNWFAKQIKPYIKGEEITPTGYKKATRDYAQEALIKAQSQIALAQLKSTEKQQAEVNKAQKELDANPLLKLSVEMAQEMDQGVPTASRPADIKYYAPFLDRNGFYNFQNAEIINPKDGNIYRANIPVFKSSDFITDDIQYVSEIDKLTGTKKFYVTGTAKIPYDKLSTIFDGDNPIDDTFWWFSNDVVEDEFTGSYGKPFTVIDTKNEIAGIPFRKEIFPNDPKMANAINAKIKPVGTTPTPQINNKKSIDISNTTNAAVKSAKDGTPITIQGVTYIKKGNKLIQQ
jgi:hypothetical protein